MWIAIEAKKLLRSSLCHKSGKDVAKYRINYFFGGVPSKEKPLQCTYMYHREMLSPPRTGDSPASSASTGKSGTDGAGAAGGEKRVKDASIICFEHCEHKLFSLNTLPSSCPECGDDLTQYSFRDLPFKLPSPLTRAQVYSDLSIFVGFF